MKILNLGFGGHKLENTGDNTVITLDCDAGLKPDIICCLGKNSIPLEDNSIDMAVAIHVLEHIGKQGETTEWFFFWEELYRVLKPGSYLEFVSPMWNSVWSWGDPGHKRALSPESFIFLNQVNYKVPNSPITPYHINCDFIPIEKFSEVNGNFGGLLFANKPLKPWWIE